MKNVNRERIGFFGTLTLVSLVVLTSCGQDTFYLVTEVDGSIDDGIDIGVDVIDIIVPTVGQGGSYPAGEPVIEIEFVIMNYSMSFDVPEDTEIPWVVRFGPNDENYATTPLGNPFPPGASFSIMRSISPSGVVETPGPGIQAFCIRTLLPGDVNQGNDELCLTFTIE